jgi:probable HAF family extracellular repeat protein
VAVLLSGAVRARAEYIITNLGTLGGAPSNATAVNASGQVVGQGPSGNTLNSGGTTTTLPSSNNAPVVSINNPGQIVGENVATGDGLLYSGGKLSALPLQAAVAINGAGQVAGAVSNGTDQRAVLYSGGNVTDFGTLGGGKLSALPPQAAVAINGAGQVAGAVSNGTDQRAALYSGGNVTDLGTLGGQSSFPTAINASGQVAGYTYSPNNPLNSARAFMYSDGKMIGLAGLGSYAYGINDAGRVVGQWNDNAFLFTNGNPINLNSQIPANSGWILSSATGINNQGQIIGYGKFGGQTSAFMLTPAAEAPEPTSLALLSLGGLGLAGHAWRKRRRAAVTS